MQTPDSLHVLAFFLQPLPLRAGYDPNVSFLCLSFLSLSFLSVALIRPLYNISRLQSIKMEVPETRVLIIITGGTICMQPSENGLVPVGDLGLSSPECQSNAFVGKRILEEWSRAPTIFQRWLLPRTT